MLERFQKLYEAGRRRTVPHSQPPVEFEPYRPPTAAAPAATSRITTQPPFAGRSAPSPSAGTLRAQQPPRTSTPSPQTPVLPSLRDLEQQRRVSVAPPSSEKPKPQATSDSIVRSMSIMPLSEPILAPPAEDRWSISEPPAAAIPQEQTLAAAPAFASPTSGLREASSLTVTEHAADGEDGPSLPALVAQAPAADLFDDFFPEDAGQEDLELETIPDEGEFVLPKTSPKLHGESERSAARTTLSGSGVPSGSPPAAVVQVEPTPYTGLTLDNADYLEPKTPPTVDVGARAPQIPELYATSPSANPDVRSTPSQPSQPGGPFFDRASESVQNESLDIGGESLNIRGTEPRILDPQLIGEAELWDAATGSRMQQIVTRDGTGMKGFCPVALRDRRVLEDGRIAYASQYEGKVYYFSSAAAKTAFDKSPATYTPAANGYDVVLTAIAHEVQEGSLDHAVWYKDRLYLFESSDTLKTFMAIPSAMSVDALKR
ncbi:MAG: hypothetical protein KF861_03710 [Planctomycetaceae bacterium]|nr:hypothetical protein [Planctomycetaceae bacterium]